MASQVFLDHVPAGVLAAMLRAVLQSYKDASSACYETMRPRQAKDASGPFRRNKIESELVGVGERFQQVISVEDNLYKRGTGNYVELTCGVVKMTESCVPSPKDFPRDADYRETLAESTQLVLGFVPAETPGKYLYAILLHGVDGTAKQRSGCRFAQVRFPLKGFASYTEDRVDLFAMFPSIVAEYSDQSATADEVHTMLPLRVIPKIGEA
jgi:hypothetical protein